jgi:hypothetical protein
MTQYLLSVYQPEGRLSPQAREQISRDLDTLNRDLTEAGAWVFAGGLCSPSTATVVRVRAGEVLMSDGPFTETKEYLGGFTIIDAPDLDAALAWADRLARATTLPIEVRPFLEQPGS